MADLLHPCSLICRTGRSKFEQTIVTLLAAAALCGVFTGRYTSIRIEVHVGIAMAQGQVGLHVLFPANRL